MRHPHNNLRTILTRATYIIVVGLAVLVFAILLWPADKTEAAVHKYINYQGKLLDSSEIQVSDGSYRIKFTIYDQAVGGANLWFDNYDVDIKNGLFSVLLGSSSTAINLDFEEKDGYWLGVEVEGDGEMTPRKEIGAVAYAFNSDLLDGLDTTTIGATASAVPAFNSFGNLTITGDPQGGAVTQGSVYINPAAPGANETLLGIANNGSQRLLLDAEGDLTLAGYVSTTQLYIDSIDLEGQGVSNVTAGAYKVGTYDEFTYSDSTNVQDVLDDIDFTLDAVSSSANIWKVGINNIYPSSSTANVYLAPANWFGLGIANPEKNFHVSGTTFMFGDVFIGSTTEEIANPHFTMDGNGFYVQGNAGFKGNAHTQGKFVVKSTTELGESSDPYIGGYTSTSEDYFTIVAKSDEDNKFQFTVTDDQPILHFASSGMLIAQPGFRLASTTGQLEYRDEDDTAWIPFDSFALSSEVLWTDQGTYIDPDNATGEFRIEDLTGHLAIGGVGTSASWTAYINEQYAGSPGGGTQGGGYFVTDFTGTAGNNYNLTNLNLSSTWSGTTGNGNIMYGINNAVDYNVADSIFRVYGINNTVNISSGTSTDAYGIYSSLANGMFGGGVINNAYGGRFQSYNGSSKTIGLYSDAASYVGMVFPPADPSGKIFGTISRAWGDDYAPNSKAYGGVFYGAVNATTTYGIWASAQSGDTNWAGYFDSGNVKINNSLFTSGTSLFSDYITLFRSADDQPSLFFASSTYSGTYPGFRLASTTGELEYRDEGDGTWTPFDSLGGLWTDAGNWIYASPVGDYIGTGLRIYENGELNTNGNLIVDGYSAFGTATNTSRILNVYHNADNTYGVYSRATSTAIIAGDYYQVPSGSAGYFLADGNYHDISHGNVALTGRAVGDALTSQAVVGHAWGGYFGNFTFYGIASGTNSYILYGRNTHYGNDMARGASLWIADQAGGGSTHIGYEAEVDGADNNYGLWLNVGQNYLNTSADNMGIRLEVASATSDVYGIDAYLSAPAAGSVYGLKVTSNEYATSTNFYGAHVYRSRPATNESMGYFSRLEYDSGNTTKYGANFRALGEGTNYGTYSRAGGGSVNYGVYGDINGGTTGYAIYGNASGATTNWAGYFAAGNVYSADNLYVGSTTQEIANGAYSLDGNDFYVQGMAGIKGNVYTNGAFIASSTSAFGEAAGYGGYASTSAPYFSIIADNDADDYFKFTALDNQAIQYFVSAGLTNYPGFRLNSTTEELEYRDEDSASWITLDSLHIWTDRGTYIDPADDHVADDVSIDTADNTFFVDVSASAIGIGTNTPSYLLDVTDATGSRVISAVNTLNGTGAIGSAAVYAQSTNTYGNTNAYAVYGTTGAARYTNQWGDSAGAAIKGVNTKTNEGATLPWATGVLGQADHARGVGVWGLANNSGSTASPNYGIYGINRGTGTGSVGVGGYSASGIAARFSDTDYDRTAGTESATVEVFVSRASAGRGILIDDIGQSDVDYLLRGYMSSIEDTTYREAVDLQVNGDRAVALRVRGSTDYTSGNDKYGIITVQGSGSATNITGVSVNLDAYTGGEGVWVYVEGDNSYGVYAIVEDVQSPNTGTSYGGYFETQTDLGYAVYGYANDPTGINYGIYGITNSEDNGWAGYFTGNNTSTKVFINSTLVLNPVPSAATSTEGSIYYDSDVDKYYGRTSSGWEELNGAAGLWTDQGLYIDPNNATGKFRIGDTDGHTAIGDGAVDSYFQLSVQETHTGNSGTEGGITIDATYTGTPTGNYDYTGERIVARYQGDGAAGVQQLIGGAAIAFMNSGGETIENEYGYYGVAATFDGTVTNAYGIYGDAFEYAGTITNSYGGYFSGASGTTNFGAYAEAVGASTGNSYGLRSLVSGESANTGYLYGVYSQATGTIYTPNKIAYGGYFSSTATASTTIGIYASATNGTGANWAGYFANGNVYSADNLYVGATAETLDNAGFDFSGDDLFVAGEAGIEGNVYSDGEFIAGSTMAMGDGYVSSSGNIALKPGYNTTTHIFVHAPTGSGGETWLLWDVAGLPINNSGLRENSSTGELEYRDENSTVWTPFDNMASLWTDRGTYIDPDNATGNFKIADTSGYAAIGANATTSANIVLAIGDTFSGVEASGFQGGVSSTAIFTGSTGSPYYYVGGGNFEGIWAGSASSTLTEYVIGSSAFGRVNSTGGGSLDAAYGFYGMSRILAGATVSSTYGIFARSDISGVVDNAYGVYGTANGGILNWSGYFDRGDVGIDQSEISNLYFVSSTMANYAGFRLNPSSGELEYRDEGAAGWVAISGGDSGWTDRGTYIDPNNATGAFKIRDINGHTAIGSGATTSDEIILDMFANFGDFYADVYLGAMSSTVMMTGNAGGAYSYLAGGGNTAIWNGSSTSTQNVAFGHLGRVDILSTNPGSLEEARGLFGWVNADGGNVSTTYGVYGRTDGSGALVDTAYGGYFRADHGSSTVGVYSRSEGNPGDYSFYSPTSGGVAYFGDRVAINGASSTSFNWTLSSREEFNSYPTVGNKFGAVSTTSIWQGNNAPSSVMHQGLSVEALWSGVSSTATDINTAIYARSERTGGEGLDYLYGAYVDAINDFAGQPIDYVYGGRFKADASSGFVNTRVTGLQGMAEGGPEQYGGYFMATGAVTDSTYGLYTSAVNGDTNYGIYSYAFGGDLQYGGYFDPQSGAGDTSYGVYAKTTGSGLNYGVFATSTDFAFYSPDHGGFSHFGDHVSIEDAATSTNAALNVKETYTADPGAVAISYIGTSSTSVWAGGSNSGAIALSGNRNAAIWNGASGISFDLAVGTYSNARKIGGGTPYITAGAYNDGRLESGTSPYVVGVWGHGEAAVGTTPTNGIFGVLGESVGKTGHTTIGVYADASGGSTNYAFYGNNGYNYFKDHMALADASPTSTAAINIQESYTDSGATVSNVSSTVMANGVPFEVRGLYGHIYGDSGTQSVARAVYGYVDEGSGAIANGTGGYFRSDDATTNYGVQARTGGPAASTNYGVYAYAQSVGTTNYAIYGKAAGATNNYAGYFSDGYVHIEGDDTPTSPDWSLVGGSGDLFVRNQTEFDEAVKFDSEIAINRGSTVAASTAIPRTNYDITFYIDSTENYIAELNPYHTTQDTYLRIQNSDSGQVAGLLVEDHISAGAIAIPTYYEESTLHLIEGWTGTSYSNVQGIFNQARYAGPGDDTNLDVSAIYNYMSNFGGAANEVQGVHNYISYDEWMNGPANGTWIRGTHNEIIMTGDGGAEGFMYVLGEMSTIDTTGTSSTTSINAVYGNYLQVDTNSTSGAITTGYGNYTQIGSGGTTVSGNWYGLYINMPLLTSGNKYGVYVSGDIDNYFGGNVSVGAGGGGDDDYVYFDADVEWLRYDETVSNKFEFSGNLGVGEDSGADDDYLYFDAGIEWLRYDETNNDRFELSGNLSIGDDSGADEDYLYFDQGIGYIQWQNVSTSMLFSHEIEMRGNYLAVNVDGPDGDAAIDFYEDGVWWSEQLAWQNVNDRFFITDQLAVNTDRQSTNGMCKDTTGTGDTELVDCNGTPNDIAEWYPIIAGTTAGDIVYSTSGTISYTETLFDPESGLSTSSTATYNVSYVDRASTAYDSRIIGIVSTSPYDRFGEAVRNSTSSTAVIALIGRVPTKVSDTNGAIKAGDLITSSDIKGVGMKATKPGMVVGTALEDMSGATDTILVFVNPMWYSGGAIHNDGTKSTLNDNFAFEPTGTASSSAPKIDSYGLTFRGGAWDAASSTELILGMTIKNEVSSTDEYGLSFANNDGDKVAFISNNGDLMLGNKLFPSDRGTMQDDYYIFLNTAGPGGKPYMMTNAAGWSTGSYDFAEMFPSDEILREGELVVVANENEEIKRSNGAYQTTLGIVSTQPGFIAGDFTTSTYPIALAGRVPTKVTNANGAIEIGDPITTSDIPGVGMKATSAGPVVGYALEASNESAGEIIVYVNPGWYGGGATAPLPGASGESSGFEPTTSGGVTYFSGAVDMQGNDIYGVSKIYGNGYLWEIDENGVVINRVNSGGATEKEVYGLSATRAEIIVSGSGITENGIAHVEFSESVTNMFESNLNVKVIVTPTSADTEGLAVTEKSTAGFTVREINSGTGAVTFDWMLMAPRVGYEIELNDYTVNGTETETPPDTSGSSTEPVIPDTSGSSTEPIIPDTSGSSTEPVIPDTSGSSTEPITP